MPRKLLVGKMKNDSQSSWRFVQLCLREFSNNNKSKSYFIVGSDQKEIGINVWCSALGFSLAERRLFVTCDKKPKALDNSTIRVYTVIMNCLGSRTMFRPLNVLQLI